MQLADLNEQASMTEEHSRELAIAAARSKPLRGVSRSECGECGDPIPKRRQEIIVGCQNCALCAEDTGVS